MARKYAERGERWKSEYDPEGNDYCHHGLRQCKACRYWMCPKDISYCQKCYEPHICDACNGGHHDYEYVCRPCRTAKAVKKKRERKQMLREWEMGPANDTNLKSLFNE